MLNSIALSDLIDLIFVLNLVWTIVWKEMINDLTSNLAFKRKIQVALMASSTMVRKYLWPPEVGMENGPQTLIWTRSKGESHLLFSKGKGSLFCFARG